MDKKKLNKLSHSVQKKMTTWVYKIQTTRRFVTIPLKFYDFFLQMFGNTLFL